MMEEIRKEITMYIVQQKSLKKDKRTFRRLKYSNLTQISDIKIRSKSIKHNKENIRQTTEYWHYNYLNISM